MIYVFESLFDGDDQKNVILSPLINFHDPGRTVLPGSHIHGSPRRFHYELNLTDDPGNANFDSLIRIHSGVATGFESRKGAIW